MISPSVGNDYTVSENSSFSGSRTDTPSNAAAAASASRRAQRPPNVLPQETASMTIRRMSGDFSEKMKELHDRSGALERYKNLIRNAPSSGADPVLKGPTKTENKLASDVADTKSTRVPETSSATKMKSVNTRYASSANRTNPASTTLHALPTNTPSSTQRLHTPKDPAMSVIVSPMSSMMKSASVRKASNKRRASDTPVDTPTSPACQEEPIRCPYPVSYEGEVGPDIQPPELTEPVMKPANPMRDSIKPNFDPISARAADSDSEEVDKVDTPPRSLHQDEEENAADVAPPSRASGKRRASRSKGHTESDMETGDPLVETLRVAGGSKTAFWVRPTSARYEMTASIGAKRKDSTSTASAPLSRSEKPLETRPPFNTTFSARRRSSTAIVEEVSHRPSVSNLGRPSKRRVSCPSTPLSARSSCAEEMNSPKNVTSKRNSNTTRKSASRVVSAAPLSARSSHDSGTGNDERVTTRQSQSFQKHCSRLSSRRGSEVSLDAAAAAPLSSASGNGKSSSSSNRRLNSSAKLSDSRRHVSISVPERESRISASATPDASKSLRLDTEDRKTTRTPPSSSLSADPAPSRSVPCATPQYDEEVDQSPVKARIKELESIASSVQENEADAKATKMKAAIAEARRAYEGRKSLGTGSAPTTSKQAVTAMLQGIVQQSRRVMPCFLCAEMQSIGAYRLHVELCQPKTEVLLKDRSMPATPELEAMYETEVPSLHVSEEDRNTFMMAAYACAKSLLVPCCKCGSRVRIHDAREHELLCGRAHYERSKAAERVKQTVERIDEGAPQ